MMRSSEVKLLLFLQREIALDLFSTMEMNLLADKLVAQALKILRVEQVFLVSVTTNGGECEMANPHTDPPVGMDSPKRCLVLEAAESLDIIRIEDVKKDERWNQDVEGSLYADAYNALLVPMVNAGMCCGVLVFINKFTMSGEEGEE
jgi:hypothetical protein